MIRFDHVNIRVTDQEAARDFLIAVVGLREGTRPPFSFPGYWLYLGDQPVVHLAPRDAAVDGGWVNHVAFAGFDLAAKSAELTRAGYRYTVQHLPGSGIPQIFIDGPERIRVELQCTAQ